MRAILLTKDKESLDSRLPSRYGLTGKPTLAQQGIAGSLGATFKAGQQVTMSNLMSLNDKLNQAQNAIDNASNNLDDIDKSQSEIDDLTNTSYQLLDASKWEKLWKGQIDPLKFYAAAYYEDEFQTDLAGEKGASIVSLGSAIARAPVPRMPYWDPLMRIVRTDEYGRGEMILPSKVAGYVNKLEGLNKSKTIAAASLIGGAASAVTNLMIINPVYLASAGWCAPVVAVAATAFATWLTIDLSLMTRYNNDKYGDIRHLGYSPEHLGSVYLPSMYSSSIMMTSVTPDYEKVNDNLLDIITFGSIANATLGTALGLSYAGNAMLSNPFTAIAGAILVSSAGALGAVATTVTMFSLIGVAAALVINTSLSPTTRTNGEDPKRFLGTWKNSIGDQYIPVDIGAYESQLSIVGQTGSNNIAPDLSPSVNPKANTNNVAYGHIGNLVQYPVKSVYQIIGDFLNVITKISITPGNIKRWIKGKKDYEFNIPTSMTNFNGSSSQVIFSEYGKFYKTVHGQFNLEDWFGVNNLSFLNGKCNVNDKVNKQVWSPQFSADKLHCKYLNMIATVYNGDYFGKDCGRNLTKKTIDKTIVIRGKSQIYDTLMGNGLWYSCVALVRFAGETKLYLLWERDAIYLPNWPANHVEQMIYNYPLQEKELPAEKLYTEDRRGRMSSAYIDMKNDKSNLRIVLRNVKSAKPQYLDGKLVNTEYDLNDFIDILTSPLHGWNEGTLKSYADQ